MIMIDERNPRGERPALAGAMLADAARLRHERAASRTGTADGEGSRPLSGGRSPSFLDRLLAADGGADADLYDWLEAWSLGVLGRDGTASILLDCDGVRVAGPTRRMVLNLVDEAILAAASAACGCRIHAMVAATEAGGALLVRVDVLARSWSLAGWERALVALTALTATGGVAMTAGVIGDRLVVDLALPTRAAADGGGDHGGTTP